MTSSTFAVFVSSLIKSGTSPLSLWNPCIRFHLITPPYLQTSRPLFPPASDSTRQKYRLLLGKPGTGKSQVLIRAISYTIRHELSVLVAAPVALLAQGYNSIFYEDVTTDTLYGAFSIPIDRPYPNEINHRINQYDLIVVDEASMISSPIFGVMASTFNWMNLRPRCGPGR